MNSEFLKDGFVGGTLGVCVGLLIVLFLFVSDIQSRLKATEASVARIEASLNLSSAEEVLEKAE